MLTVFVYSTLAHAGRVGPGISIGGERLRHRSNRPRLATSNSKMDMKKGRNDE
jgi:hypothetical protein